MGEKPPDYFEGILQLRDVSDEVMDWVHDEIQASGRAKIANVKEVHGGIDVYLSSNSYLRSLGKKMQDRFGGILKVTKKIHTRDTITSKDVWRITVLFRQIPFKKGEIIKFQGEQWEVLMVGGQISLKNVSSGAKKRVSAERLTAIRKRK